MMRVPIHKDQVQYDADHDVLHVRLGSPGYSVDDEDFPGVFVRRSITDESVTGLVILDFSKRQPLLSKLLPDYDFSELQIH